MRKNKLVLFGLCLLISVFMNFSFGPARGAEKSKKTKTILAGDILPDFSLPGPESEKARHYLGLKNAEPFSIFQIPGKLILVEFYSMYCPICQRQAPRMNKLHKFIQQDPELRQDIKVIGIGLGNKKKEIRVYKETFRVRFPLFDDPNKEIVAKTGIEDIPLTLLVDKKGKVLVSHLGAIKNLDQFLGEIRQFQKKL